MTVGSTMTVSADCIVGSTLVVGSRLNVGGNCAVGTDMKVTSTLNVIGDTKLQSNLTVGKTLHVTGTIVSDSSMFATAFSQTSDYRIKQNTISLNDDSATTDWTIDNLNPVHFTNTKTHKQEIGLLAHEVQEHFPFMVNGDKDGTELQSVNYIGLISVLIYEVQKIKKQLSKV